MFYYFSDYVVASLQCFNFLHSFQIKNISVVSLIFFYCFLNYIWQEWNEVSFWISVSLAWTSTIVSGRNCLLLLLFSGEFKKVELNRFGSKQAFLQLLDVMFVFCFEEGDKFKFEVWCKFDCKCAILQCWQDPIGVLFMFVLRLKEGDICKLQVLCDSLKVQVQLDSGFWKIIESFDHSSIDTFFEGFGWNLVILLLECCLFFVFFFFSLCFDVSVSMSLSEKLVSVLLSVLGQEYFLLQRIWTNTTRKVQPNLKKQHLWSS